MDGNQSSHTLKTTMRAVPVKKVGTENPTMVMKVPAWSKTEYCRQAEKTPTGTAMRMATM